MSQTFFCKDWLQHPDYKDWLGAVPDNRKVARCTTCSKTFELSNMGVGAIKSHMDGKKHKSVKPASAFFSTGKKKQQEHI